MSDWEPNRTNYERRSNIKVYRERKIRILTDEFLLKLTPTEIYHFHELNTHADIDAYAHSLLVDKL